MSNKNGSTTLLIDYVYVDSYECGKCKHEWIPRGKPSMCPKCKRKISTHSGRVYTTGKQDQIIRIAVRDGGKCKKCEATEKLQLDHIMPKSKGGSSEDSNLQLLCAKCNKAKGVKLEW